MNLPYFSQTFYVSHGTNTDGRASDQYQDREMRTFVVTRVGAESIDRVVPLFDAYRQFYRQEADLSGARQFLEAHFEHKTSTIFLCTDTSTGEDVGFVQLYPVFSSVRMKSVWILNDLFVHTAARRCGVASRLLEAAAEFARSTDAAGLQLETEKSNEGAQALYEKHGWREEETAIHYTLDL